MKHVILLVLLVLACSAAAQVMLERSPDNRWSRLYNTSNIAFYCWIELNNGEVYQGMLYPGRGTPWYKTYDVHNWDCEG